MDSNHLGNQPQGVPFREFLKGVIAMGRPNSEWAASFHGLGPRTEEQEEVSGTLGFIPLCLLFVPAMGPAASLSCCYTFHTVMGYIPANREPKLTILW